MNTIPIKLNVEYYLPYVPQRCRKVRYERVSEDIAFKVKSVTSEEAPIAFILSDFSHVEDGTTEMWKRGTTPTFPKNGTFPRWIGRKQ